MQNPQGSHRVGFGQSCISLKVVARHSLTDMQPSTNLTLPIITCSKYERDLLLLTIWVISGSGGFEP